MRAARLLELSQGTTLYLLFRADSSGLRVAESPPAITGNSPLIDKSANDTDKIGVADIGDPGTFTYKPANDVSSIFVSDVASPPNIIISKSASDSTGTGMRITESPNTSGTGIDFSEGFEGAANGVVADETTTAFTTSIGTANGAMTHSTTRSINGTRSLRILNPTGNTSLYHVVTPPPQLYRRWYYYVVTNNAGQSIARLQTSATLESEINIDGTSRINILDSTGIIGTMNTQLNSGQWYRFEWLTNVAAGTETVRLYTGANLHTNTLTETITVPTSTVSYTRVYIGVKGNNTNDVFYDEYAESTSGWLGAYNSSSGTSSIVITTGGTTADVTRSASDTGGLKITESWSRNITTPSAVVTRFRSGAWHEKPIPANPIIHSNNANLIKELSARYNGPETDGQTATGYNSTLH